jgi:hypothetical protein
MSDDKWQPIETVPKDGTVILICQPGYGGPNIWAATWASEHDGRAGSPDKDFPWLTLDDGSTNALMDGPEHGPTHWMPLPGAPK